MAGLRQGSVAVAPSHPLVAGAVLGEVGNSGNSIAPHLHVQVMSSPDPLLGEIVPWRLASTSSWRRTVAGSWSRTRCRRYAVLRPPLHN
jgi:hypothetical protein